MKVFTTNKEKLNFIIKHLKLKGVDIASKFGVNPTSISKMFTENNTNELKPMHLYAFENIYDIPYKIFEDIDINTKEKIISILDKRKELNKNNIFNYNENILNSLEGTWYAYFYSSHSNPEIYSIETKIDTNGNVKDENNNFGKVFIGKQQSIIIKEAYNSGNLISLTFDNIQIAYGIFIFTLVSNANHNNCKMCNYGFFSKEKLNIDIAKKMLKDKNRMQLKIDYTFTETISEFAN